MQWIKTAGCFLAVVVGLGLASGVVAQPGGTEADAVEASTTQGKGKASGGPPADDKMQSRPFISTGLSSDALATQRPDQAVWLDAGSNGRVLGLLEQEAKSPAKGAVLIVADEGQTADSALAGALRQPLTAAGWAAMTLGLEPPPYPVVRARRQSAESGLPAQPEDVPDAGNETQPSGAPAESGSIMIDVMDKVDLDQLRQDYREKLDTQVGAAVSHLRGKGYQRVALIGVGRGAAPVARLAMNGIGRGQGEPQALVWVVPTLDRTDLDALGSARATELRILDLQSGRMHEGVTSERQSTLRRAGFRGYDQQQVAIARRPAALDARQVASRILAWLQRLFFPET